MPRHLLRHRLRRRRKLRDKICAPSDFNVKQPAKPKEIKRRFADAAKLSSDCAESGRGGGEEGGGDALARSRWA